MAPLVAQPQLTWNLDPTAVGLVNVFIKFLEATTRDNVQVLAMSACREFGGTLAMSIDTCKTIETTIVPTPGPAVVKLLKTLVGYYEDDAVRALGDNAAGVQFLGLACAILTVPLSDAAEALQDMLMKSATNLKHVPSREYLKQFLECLEPRCSKSTFLTKVNEYAGSITQGLRFFGSNVHLFGRNHETAPSPKGLTILVDVFRELCRIGDTETYGAEIRAGACAAWVAAFSEWCLGVQPSIVLEDNKSVHHAVLEPNGSIVRIVIPTDADGSPTPLSAQILRKVGGLETLVSSGTEPQYGGMVDIEDYGKWLLRDNGFSKPRLCRLLHIILPHAVSRVLSSATCRNQEIAEMWDQDHSSDIQERRGYVSGRLLDLCLSPFPERTTIRETYSRLFAQDHDICDRRNYEHALTEDIPEVRTELEALGQKCPCDNCQRSVALSSTERFDRSCLRYVFLYRIATLVADVLALSLFVFPEGLRVQMGRRFYQQRPQGFISCILPILRFGNSTDCDPRDVLAWARAMVGHRDLREKPDQQSDWILSCAKGQAVFPSLLDTPYYIDKDGFLALNWLPGVLQYEGTTWQGVIGEESTWAPDQPNGMEPQIQVSSPLNLFPSSSVDIAVTIADDRILKAKLVLEDGQSVSHTSRNPIHTLLGLQSGLIAENCGHPSDENLQEPDTGCLFIAPEALPSTRLTSTISVVPVDGDDSLRFFSIPGAEQSEGREFVLRKDACLSCALKVCRQAGISILIL